ncbi:hypothetical protein DBIPINDM_008366 (plasmid) [Mesorhizobium sp. AR02]|uniref:hypothetical protein n=1 Tax=Mesorhizobium sp. AR02 TaxID=2865837 RepID=UPI00215F9199|nr:hypothetical protein [Mesorhizobium sp. AR02]UVK57409.1 hypothetical protein DBIPINDM_008366 [Mesorhizobium sp. AR02]
MRDYRGDVDREQTANLHGHLAILVIDADDIPDETNLVAAPFLFGSIDREGEVIGRNTDPGAAAWQHLYDGGCQRNLITDLYVPRHEYDSGTVGSVVKRNFDLRQQRNHCVTRLR